ncbi:sulfatase-like hydrolase/transferase [Paenibacillus sp. CC-CFT747]|nr:sulfatase-like hydrolase/transferase [Paenibacillus sp. CC-CFT747]
MPEPYASLYDPKQIALPPNYHDSLKDKPGLYRRMRRNFDQLDESEVRESIAHYWGYCTMMDDMLGEVLETLERCGMQDNTLVLFLSDHGEHAGAHGLYAKGLSHFEEGYRVPCVMRWPGGLRSPAAARTPSYHWPTWHRRCLRRRRPSRSTAAPGGACCRSLRTGSRPAGGRPCIRSATGSRSTIRAG